MADPRNPGYATWRNQKEGLAALGFYVVYLLAHYSLNARNRNINTFSG
jgi:hypothetical protein